MPKYSKNPPRSSSRLARQPSNIVPSKDTAALRMREASTRNGMGRKLHCRSDKWDILATDIVFTVSQMSTLFPTKHGPVQR